MTCYVAFLRGVSPTNATMAGLRRAFESAGFSRVRTVLATGNVIFDARTAPPERLERRCEEAIHATLGRSFAAIVRSAAHLNALIDAAPFDGFELPATAKRVVTFLRDERAARPVLPIARDGATILAQAHGEVFTAYVPGPKGPVFMTLLERTYGTDITTRTLDTVGRCVRACGS